VTPEQLALEPPEDRRPDCCPTCGRELDDPGRNRLGGYARDSATSRNAALANFPRSGTQRLAVLQAVYLAGPRGATSDEISARHGIRLYSVKPRLLELRRGGWVARNGDVRRSDVYVLTTKGLERFRDVDELGARRR